MDLRRNLRLLNAKKSQGKKFEKGDILTINWSGSSKVIVMKSDSKEITLVRLSRTNKPMTGDENSITLSEKDLLEMINKEK